MAETGKKPTKDDIIRMAREADFEDSDLYRDVFLCDHECLERFAALVAATERETCAKLFDDRNNGIGYYEPHEPAEIIRARGQQ